MKEKKRKEELTGEQEHEMGNIGKKGRRGRLVNQRVNERKRERVCVCEREREREKERVSEND